MILFGLIVLLIFARFSVDYLSSVVSGMAKVEPMAPFFKDIIISLDTVLRGYPNAAALMLFIGFYGFMFFYFKFTRSRISCENPQ
jgi:hypothetical protein